MSNSKQNPFFTFKSRNEEMSGDPETILKLQKEKHRFQIIMQVIYLISIIIALLFHHHYF